MHKFKSYLVNNKINIFNRDRPLVVMFNIPYQHHKILQVVIILQIFKFIDPKCIMDSYRIFCLFNMNKIDKNISLNFLVRFMENSNFIHYRVDRNSWILVLN